MTLICQSCGDALVPVQANVNLEKSGINVLIIGGKGVGCRRCETIQELDLKVETKVNEAIHRKIKECPDSQQVLTMNLLALF